MRGFFMKKLLITGIAAALFSGSAFAEQAALSETDKLSYSLGRSVGTNLKAQVDADVNLEMMMKGIAETLTPPDKELMSEEEVRQTLTDFHKARLMKQEEERRQEGLENLKAGEDFLRENKAKEGVKELPSGLQYKVLNEGTGKTPKLEDTVTTHYKGTLLDGTEFDSSYSRGEPVKFKVNQVIAGWTQALQMMQEGDKWQLFLPPQLAYGERGAPPKIAPQSTLVFEVELLSVEEDASATAE
jgi:FKBP-type peptidyl-prolyl cis-trans isomerase FklB